VGLKRRQDYASHSRKVIRSKRWHAIRIQALRRDGWKCVQCKATGRLEVDHIKPVRDEPDLAFDLANLQSLCVRCHSRKTRIEVGFGHEVDPKRQAWRNLVDALARHQQEETACCNL
jgi:5-methylcytosine-specific restriction endonuclease McrA